MTKFLALVTITFLMSPAAQAETRIDTLCGSGHRNEVAGPQDIKANPAGYYVTSLRTQLPLGDPRIVQATGDVFHLCTSSAATPDMETTRALLLMQTREVKYLFVPVSLPVPVPTRIGLSGDRTQGAHARQANSSLHAWPHLGAP